MQEHPHTHGPAGPLGGTRTGGRWAAALLGLLAACSGGGTVAPTAESCMTCHNGSPHDDYAGPGMENPHPFEGADAIRCTVCHGGDPNGQTPQAAHVPPPPQIGDDAFQDQNREAWFNRLTLTGMDRYPDYQVGGVTHTALEYLQFVNPGDLRVVTQGQSCGSCHATHAECVNGSLLATEGGMFSGATFAAGMANTVPESVGRYEDTAADLSFRAVEDPDFQLATAGDGAVPRLLEYPVKSQRNVSGPDQLFNNPAFDAALLSDDQHADGRVIDGSPLATLFREQVAFTCGDCHLGSAGANNRAGDFRSSGCTACHMPYSLGGRAGSRDPNINRVEPADPDDIDDPERAHVAQHRIVSVHKTAADGTTQNGIGDLTCAGCHQGSNRTVMQYWGIRLDQNQDVRFGNQYPANPVDWDHTGNDTRLFDPEVGNHTFNGRNRFQYLAFEDYDGDGRDDTPPDVHHAAGMGCIDCHGSHDMHGGDVSDPSSFEIQSRMEQAVSIRCQDCHGSVDSYAATTSGTTYAGDPAEIGVDSEGHPMRHVTRDADGHYWLRSRLDGQLHYLSQVRDLVVDNGRLHPTSGDPLYSAPASYAMGRADGNPATGLGPLQTAGNGGFSHMDDLDCSSCHSSWTNNCIGCHLVGEYNTSNNFSNITGERIVFREKFADFTYQSPVFFQLGVGPEGKVAPLSPNTKVFFSYEDQENDLSEVFHFSDRKGSGSNPAQAVHPSLSHNAMMPHSIRGKVDAQNEGVRQCVSCHLTADGLATFGTEYDAFRAALASPTLTGLDQPMFDLMAEHLGQNPGNQLNSPLFVHMAAGLGTGLFLFDDQGAPVNPLDDDADRKGAGGVAPSTVFDLARVALNLDRLVNPDGSSTGSSNHTMDPAGSALRDGALDPGMSGPLGETLVRRLTHPTLGIVLDSWFDADGQPQGDAGTAVND